MTRVHLLWLLAGTGVLISLRLVWVLGCVVVRLWRDHEIEKAEKVAVPKAPGLKHRRIS